MPGRSRRSRDDSGQAGAAGAGPLAAVLAPHLDELEAAARARAERERLEQAAAERAAARAGRRRLDEAELMALIFAHLDHENPRVCEGIEFERLIILSGPAEPEPPESEPPAPEPPEPEPEPSEPEPPEPGPDPAAPDGRAWIGRTWIDDIRPIPAAVLDRPQLAPDQRALLLRAGRRELDSLNLRHLDRAAALAHLDVFVRACRARRHRFCRVIPGKGIGSRAEPVLKRAVLERCREPALGVLGWAPELDRHGEWGAVILELRAPGR